MNPFNPSGPVGTFWKGLKCQTPGCDGKGSHIWFSHDRNIQEIACLEVWAEESGLRLRFERVPTGIRISISDIDKGIDIDEGAFTSATVKGWVMIRFVPVSGATDIPFDRGEWTNKTVAALRQLWDLGFSAKAIGDYLHLTKNAVIGKSHRLGLPSRPSPVKRDGYTPPKPVRGRPVLPSLPGDDDTRPGAWATPQRVEILRTSWPTHKPLALIILELEECGGPPLPTRNAVSSYAHASLGLHRPEGFRRVCEVPRSSSAEPSAVPAPKPRPVVGRRPAEPRVVVPRPVAPAPKPYARVATCCWPTNDGHPQWTFCGQPSESGRPYCEDHVRIAYRKVSTPSDNQTPGPHY